MISSKKFHTFHNSLMNQIDLQMYYQERGDKKEVKQCRENILKLIDELRYQLGFVPLKEMKVEQLDLKEVEDLFK